MDNKILNLVRQLEISLHSGNHWLTAIGDQWFVYKWVQCGQIQVTLYLGDDFDEALKALLRQ